MNLDSAYKRNSDEVFKDENMNTKWDTKIKKRLGVSPILATVVLLGITVVGGGLTFAVFSQGLNTSTSQTLVALENAQAVKGTGHADLTATIKNTGSKPLTKIEMTVSKTDLSEPILYEALHENVLGCDADCNLSTAKPLASPNNNDNPLRAQWIAHLDLSGGTKDVADKGEGISVGRKFELTTGDLSMRTIKVPNGTSVQKLMVNFGTERANSNIPSTAFATCTIVDNTSWVDCQALFDQLDPSGARYTNIMCKGSGPAATPTSEVECKAFSHRKLSAPLGPGQSIQIYADAFTKAVPGLNNQVLNSGDGLVTNVVATADDGSSVRVQTVIKVTGI
ncbi:hypothetical protein [Candidatus Nitrosotenuis uzonensis]|uniref:Uncharacterized protein n=1 Tax=Candidatus Nitrosotenuis uzonensis TaxID=1407055 RepID=V6ASW2_9ARCH|nr:hypothetical protein [Candidatus Nitrosotenuis uzonensis]CDI05654.1 hypothetical protein NITUZ_30346 [Candidatus Nitrosotenuis uzonensis]